MTIHRPKRITDKGPTDDLSSDDLIVMYSIEYEDLSMENFGVAMVSLLTALPEDRLWTKPMIYQSNTENSGVIHVEGIKRKVFEEAQV